MAQSAIGSIAIIIACIVSALFALAVLRHYWAPSSRLAHNDVVGPNVSVIGTTYAVLIAFMLSGVWTNLQAARLNAEQEANNLVNIYRFAYQLPAESRTQIQALARGYCAAMLSEEWPAMERQTQSPTAHKITQQLWHALTGVQPRNANEQTVMDHSLSELTGMTEHRRIRLLQSRQRLPALLWAVLVVGGIVTVGSTCLFGVDNFKLHMVQVFEISFLLSLMLVAIASINRPYQGDVHVSPEAFRYALETMDEPVPAAPESNVPKSALPVHAP
ncbi:MAG TPA: hypothetical protein VLL05_00810 [Terriglobales bacterium]|nr:hypothetical protein [Terriglobales bacterium]